MKKRILALMLALLLTAGLSLNAFAGARDVASAYRTRIQNAKLFTRTDPVALLDVTGDGLPELFLLTQGTNCVTLQCFTWRADTVWQLLSLQWYEVAASRHALYLRKDGSLAWYYVNGDGGEDYYTDFLEGKVYTLNAGGSYVQSYHYSYNTRHYDDGRVEHISSQIGDKAVSMAEGKAADEAFRTQFDTLILATSTQFSGKSAATSKAQALDLLGKVEDFFDVPADAYYAPAVRWAVANSVTAGTSAYTFSPDQVCTRAQVVTFLWRAAGSPDVAAATAFSDVPKDAYYAKAVSWAVANGVTQGTGAGKFSPGEPCTRAQVVTFLWRAAGSPNAAASTAFSDVPTGVYYAKAVSWAVSRGVTQGTGNGLFSPAQSCTRAQVVTFLYRQA